MTDTLTIPESVLLCIMFGATALAMASWFAGYWYGVANERKRKGL